MSNTTSTVTNINQRVAPEFQPYISGLAGKAEALSNAPYIPYGYTQDAEGNVVRASTNKPFDVAAFAKANPDIAAEAARVVKTGEFSSPEAFYSYWAKNNPEQAKAVGYGVGTPTTYTPTKYNAEGLEVDANGVPVIGQRITGFNKNQLQTQNDVLGLKTPGAFGDASSALGQSGIAALAATKYNAGNFSADQVQAERIAAERVAAERAAGASMDTAKTGYNPQLTQYQIAAPEQFGQAQAQQLMSPYMQSVVDIQKQAAIQDAKKDQLTANLGAARQGTYGGARQLLATTERERALGTNLNNIQASGLQNAYQSAQQQFNTQQAAAQQAALANQQSSLGVQSLGTQTGLQTALANLSAEQQANVQNLAAKLQTQGLNVDSALRAALANQSSALSASQSNQQTGLQAAISNQQANLEAQRMAEASRQFGASLGLQGSQQLGQLGQTYINQGSAQQQNDLARLQAQQNVGAQQQGLTQANIDTSYNDWLAQKNNAKDNLAFYGNFINGLPLGTSSTSTTSAPSPNPYAQYLGTGAAALSTYNALKP